MEDSPSPHEGSDPAGDPTPGACGVPEELVGRRTQNQGRQSHFGGSPAVQAAVKVRAASHCLCDRYMDAVAMSEC